MIAAKDVIHAWLKNNPMVFRNRWDGDVVTLIELASGKQLSFDAKSVTNHRLTPHPQGFGEYLNLVFDGGKEIVLCHAGVAFAPSFNSTGPLPDAPPVSCMSDFFTLSHTLDDIKADPTRKPEALLLFNVLISILDGAKAVGLDVGYEEEKLDAKLTEFEKGFAPTA
jgi:hypothetical protein